MSQRLVVLSICVMVIYLHIVDSDRIADIFKHHVVKPGLKYPTVAPVIVHDELEGHPNWALLPTEDECGRYGRRGPVYPKLLPWMVMIRNKNSEGDVSECTGTIISARYVLTAATCVMDHNETDVILGVYNETELIAEWRESDSVEQTILHPDYSIDRELSLTNNDIALLRLQEPVDFDYETYARPICLPLQAGHRKRNITTGEYTGRLAGWQKNNQNESVLNRMKVPILGALNCTSAYKRSYYSEENPTENKICAGVKDPDPELHLESENSCNYSPGSPMMAFGYYKESIITYQFAVSSLHHKKCESGVPSLYVDIRNYMKWILETIKH